MRDVYDDLSVSFPVTLPDWSIVALATWPASTFVFQSEKSIAFALDVLGVNNSNNVKMRPINHSECVQRGSGFFGGGFGGSFGGPERAGLER
jgi:hypothetical protein